MRGRSSILKYIMNIHDNDLKKTRDLWIENGQVRYAELPRDPYGVFQMNTKEFDIFPGKITIDSQAGEAFREGNGISYVKRLLLYGFTSFIHLIDINYETDTTERLRFERESLVKCPVDYIHAVRVPLSRISESWIRNLKQQSVPIIILTAESAYELAATPWQRIVEAMFPRRILLLCEASEKVSENEKIEIASSWNRIIDTFRLNSFFSFPLPGSTISPFLAKRIGLYPKKGSLVMGSDADYVMYSILLKDKPVRLPDVIILRGKIVKYGAKWCLSNIKGQELMSLVPEKFLPIQDIFRYEDMDNAL